MRLLLTNDDGFDAPGLRALYERFEDRHEVFVAAPELQQSGSSHRITVAVPLRAQALSNGMRGWSISGTPADCVKLALRSLLEARVDFVISGINQGSNAGILAHYSGTVAAAKEAAIMGFPAMAVSLCGYRKLDYGPAAEIAETLLTRLAAHPLKPRSLLNVNVPAIHRDEIKGIRLVPMNAAALQDDYERRVDPRGQPYYWLSGNISVDHDGSHDDYDVIAQQYVAVTPLRIDWTDAELLAELKGLEEVGS